MTPKLKPLNVVKKPDYKSSKDYSWRKFNYGLAIVIKNSGPRDNIFLKTFLVITYGNGKNCMVLQVQLQVQVHREIPYISYQRLVEIYFKSRP